MGSTKIVAALVRETELAIANVGDSNIYMHHHASNSATHAGPFR